VSSDSNRYAIELTGQATKELSKLETQLQIRVRLAFDLLASNPRPPKSVKLRDSNTYRVRVGNYRVLYKIFDRKLVVVVIKVDHRSRVYRG
jgi:mRNA interferase RelE/StbE